MKTRTREAMTATGAVVAAPIAIALVILVVLALSAGVWGLTVWFSGTKGSGDVHKDQQSAQNREYWSAKFNTDWQSLQADKENLATLQQTATGTGATQQDRQNLLGAQLNCRTDAATYNADTANVLAVQWLPAGFPVSIDSNDYCGK